MSNKERREAIIKLWMRKYSPIGIVDKLQGEVTLKEVYHTIKQSNEAKEARERQLKLNKEVSVYA